MKKFLIKKFNKNFFLLRDNNHEYSCEHKIVIDYIDIDLDRSQTIKYCEKCMMDFTNIDIKKKK